MLVPAADPPIEPEVTYIWLELNDQVDELLLINIPSTEKFLISQFDIVFEVFT